MQKFYDGTMRDMTLLTKRNLDSFRANVDRHFLINTKGEFAPNNLFTYNFCELSSNMPDNGNPGIIA